MLCITSNNRGWTHQALLWKAQRNITVPLFVHISVEVNGVSVGAGPNPWDGKGTWDVFISCLVLAAAFRNFDAAERVVAAVWVKLSVGDVHVHDAQKEWIVTYRLVCVVPEYWINWFICPKILTSVIHFWPGPLQQQDGREWSWDQTVPVL